MVSRRPTAGNYPGGNATALPGQSVMEEGGRLARGRMYHSPFFRTNPTPSVWPSALRRVAHALVAASGTACSRQSPARRAPVSGPQARSRPTVLGDPEQGLGVQACAEALPVAALHRGPGLGKRFLGRGSRHAQAGYAYRATPKAAAFQRGSSEASRRSRTRRRSWPAAVSAQNHRAISSPPAAGFIAMWPSKYRVFQSSAQ